MRVITIYFSVKITSISKELVIPKIKKKLNLAKTSIIKELTIYASEKFLFLDYIFDNLLNFFDIFKIAYFF